MGKTSSTFDKVLDCGRSLIVSGGYNGFSYADIAEVPGIRKPGIHHHFPIMMTHSCPSPQLIGALPGGLFFCAENLPTKR